MTSSSEQTTALIAEAVPEWRPIVGYEGIFEVSSIGGIRRVGGGELKTHPATDGRMRVTLNHLGKPSTRTIHRIVAEAFIGPCPEGMECCHNNGDPTDNRVSNLRWDTHVNNLADKITHGTHPWINRTHCAEGHEFTPENSVVNKRSGQRDCRTCVNARHARAYARRKAQRDRCACGHDWQEHDGMGDCRHEDGRTSTGFCRFHESRRVGGTE